MWKWVYGVKEQAIIVLLQSLNGNKNPKKTISNLTTELLYNNNGLKIALEKLEGVFQSEEIEDGFLTYSKFSNIKWQQNMLIKLWKVYSYIYLEMK